jgi:hypothetical protein
VRVVSLGLTEGPITAPLHSKQPHQRALCNRSRSVGRLISFFVEDGVSVSQRSRLLPRSSAALAKGLGEGIRLKRSCTYVTTTAHPCQCQLCKYTNSSGSTRSRSLIESVALLSLSPILTLSLEPTELHYEISDGNRLSRETSRIPSAPRNFSPHY